MVAKMASDAEKRINLTALQRRDPYINDILDSATQVALYTFNPTTNEWEKTEIEGTLFVYRRIAPPCFGFTIMNRLSMDNLTEPLGSDIDFQNQSPFLLYRNAKLNIYGIWFYDQYDCTRIGKLLAEKCEEAKRVAQPATPSTNGTAKNTVLPSPSSTGGSTTSSLSENAIEEDSASTTADNQLEEVSGATKVANGQSNNLMNILFKAKEDYDKTHEKTVNQRKQGEKPSKLAQLFQPIRNEESKKLNVSTLFESSELQKANNTERPLSAEIFGKILPDNGNVELPRQRRPTRSMSLCLSNSATPPSVEVPIKGIVNGAISVEELESPVLGTNSSRYRHHSVSENALRQSPKPVIETDSAFHKLLSKMAVQAKSGGSAISSPTLSNPQDLTAQLLSGMKMANNSADQKVTRRQLSLSTTAETKNFVLNSTLPSTSFSQSSILPVLHEQPKPGNKTFAKSMSVASGLSILTANSGLTSLPTSALHSNSELLSPNILQSSLSEEQAMATTLGLRPSSNAKKLPNTPTPNVNPTTNTSKPSVTQPENIPSENGKLTLISPEDFEHSTSNALRQRLMSENQQDPMQPLDENQLASVLVHLLQTNQSFVDTIHKAYLSNLKQGTFEKGCEVSSSAVWK